MTGSNMYRGVAVWGIFCGCRHACAYCRVSFQAQLKRWAKANCSRCYDFVPHVHPERLNKLPSAKEIFVGGNGDLAFATDIELAFILSKIRSTPRKTFLIQTKAPRRFADVEFPDNVLFGVTAETNRPIAFDVSRAPPPAQRLRDLAAHKHRRKFITIEPIMRFDIAEFELLIYDVRPERVWIGYANRFTGLDEPELAETRALIGDLGMYYDVREKTMREPIAVLA